MFELVLHDWALYMFLDLWAHSYLTSHWYAVDRFEDYDIPQKVDMSSRVKLTWMESRGSTGRAWTMTVRHVSRAISQCRADDILHVLRDTPGRIFGASGLKDKWQGIRCEGTLMNLRFNPFAVKNPRRWENRSCGMKYAFSFITN